MTGEPPTPQAPDQAARSVSFSGSPQSLWTGLVLLGAWLFLTGCSMVHSPDIVIGSVFVPANVHREAPKLPASLRRVAVLPLATSLAGSADTAAQETLEPILQEELAMTRRFELVGVPAERLQQRTGRARWTADEKLPVGFLEFLREAYACDGVLFTQVTVFRPYPPLATGWRFKLVTADGRATLWAADEVFDAGQPAVVNGARRYQQGQHQPGGPLDESRAILNSPRRFGHYSASTLLATLPER